MPLSPAPPAAPVDPAPHALPLEQVARTYASDAERGLTSDEATARLAAHGPNQLPERAPARLFARAVAQLRSLLVLLLLAAAVVSWAAGETVDAVAILAIVVLNTVLGVVQEARAERSLAALGRLAAPAARVMRNGLECVVPARELVAGDVVLLESGNFVPADLRLTQSANLRIEEASLTGESLPASKDARVTHSATAAPADRSNSAFMGTLVTAGRGQGVVVGTALGTELGKIAALLEREDEAPSPLQHKLDELGRWLVAGSLVVCGAVLALGLVRDTELALLGIDRHAYWLAHGEGVLALFMAAVSLAIAAVPEGLPAVVTICLALGMQRMARRNALILRLPAVETLGNATVICTDKTGTLTQNRMTVVRGWVAGGGFEVTGTGRLPVGEFLRSGQPIDPNDPEVDMLLTGAVACSDARLRLTTGEGQSGGDEPPWQLTGDPTEGALLVAAQKRGTSRGDVDASLPRVSEIPFDAERKRMTTIHAIRGEEACPAFVSGPLEGAAAVAFVKGAPDMLLGSCTRLLSSSRILPLDQTRRHEALALVDGMARSALRVLAIAFRPLPHVPPSGPSPDVEGDLMLVGLVGMHDPARPEVREAIETARGAGLRTIIEVGLLGNRWLVFAVMSSLVLLLASIYLPPLQPAFGTVALGPVDWLALLPFAAVAATVAETMKLAGRAFGRR